MDDRLMYRKTFYIGGEWAPGAGPDYLEIVSPSTEEVVGGVPAAIEEDLARVWPVRFIRLWLPGGSVMRRGG
jgi:aldehyde dehydrogenase (NAD+)